MTKQGHIFSKLIVPLIILAIVCYLVFSAWNGLRDPHSFVIAYTDVMEESVDAQGWVIRSEQPVSGGGDGLIQLLRDQGEHVARGAELAVVYQDETYEEYQDQLMQAREDLGALQYATYSGSPSGSTLEDQMMAALTELRTAGSTGNFTKLNDETEDYRKLVLRREFLVSEEAEAEMTAAAAELYARYESLQSYQSGAATITAEAAGMFSTHLDGYETLLTPDLLGGASAQTLESFAKMTPLDGGGSLGKLVTNPAWYYVAALDGEYSSRLAPNRLVDIYFEAINQTLEMEVVTVGEIQDGQVVVVFRSTQDEHEAEVLRQEVGRVILRSEEGILIPKEAMRVTEDGENGVYVAKGYNAWFRPARIIAENESFYLVEPDPVDERDERILRSGDELVLSSTELYNGKVVH